VDKTRKVSVYAIPHLVSAPSAPLVFAQSGLLVQGPTPDANVSSLLKMISSSTKFIKHDSKKKPFFEF